MLTRFLALFILSTFCFAAPPIEIDPLDNMPILGQRSGVGGEAPTEQRGPEFRKFLAASVKIGVSGGSGSGTIVYYDPEKNLAYVATCGHLWSSGTMSAEEGKKRNLTCKIIIWYQNDKKLEAPKTYTANVVFYSYLRGADSALVTFTPDWTPEYFPFAPANYEYKKGVHAHSCGCDGGNEVAHYDVEMIGVEYKDLVTIRNGPRPGRSGGGLMDDNGFYIGTCWGTEFRDGSGRGYFTPLSVIHQVYGGNGYNFLLNLQPGGSVARQIPIRDRNTPQGNYPKDYIILPGR